MAQIWRRLVYLAVGLAPALFVLPMARAFGGVVSLGAFAGIAGLAIAAVLPFPTSRAAYWVSALLLTCGLAAMLPFSVVLLYGTVADLVAGSTGVPFVEATRDLFVRLWGFGGPVACAFHFLWRARCAPNNSFKPKPLRGSA
jgi:hypothetical protein